VKNYRIRFNRPLFIGKEIEYIKEAVKLYHYEGDGLFTKKCSHFLERELGVPRALITTSCTHALEMAALLLDIGPGDEFILPSFAFVSTANAFVMRGAKPVFADINPDTLNINERLLEGLINPCTKAIVPLHYAGVGCEMDEICRISKKYDIPVVEDAALGVFGKYKGTNLGSFGSLSTMSFHATKTFTCGEGGALLINDAGLIPRAEIIREKGTDRSKFLRGEIDKYTWKDLGSSYLPSDILAAFLFAQLEAYEIVQKKRKELWNTYLSLLSDDEKFNGIKLPSIPPYCEPSYSLFYLLCPSIVKTNFLIDQLRKRGVQCESHYPPLHLSPMGKNWGYKRGDLPLTEDLSSRLVRLPFHNELKKSEQKKICSYIAEVTAIWRAG